MSETVTSTRKWLPIAGFPGYEISRDGKARRIYRNAMDQWCDKELKPDVDDRGRKRYTLRRNNKSHKRLASRLVLEAFVGLCPDGMECCHENGDETDNHVENLRWDTHSANLLDRRRHGTAVCGEAVWTSKLTKDNVIAIRRRRDTGEKLKDLALEFGVTIQMISYIANRKNWQHVD
jgi:hypothetical protein